VSPQVRVDAAELSQLLGLHAPTPEQAAVIEAPLEPAVVIAGAGSGKTETMAARVLWLVANRHVRPDAVLGLTFTRKAAAELSNRIRRRLGQWRSIVERDPGEQEHLAELLAGEPTVLTYAAYAGRLVAEHALRLGAEPDARLISQALAWQLADEVSRRHPGRLPSDIGAPSSVPRYVLAMAGQLADHLVSPDEVERFSRAVLDAFEALPRGEKIRSDQPGSTKEFVASSRHRLELLPLVRAFGAAKAALPAVDFADQMTLAARLAVVPEVAETERSRYGAVLLDEYQDTGHAQVETLRGLFGDGHPLTAVGDPFQSIYGWRGASAGNIGRFATTFRRSDGEAAPVFPLATSFRNDRRILDVANAVAEPLRSGPTTVALRPSPAASEGRVEAVRTATVHDEARWVAQRLHVAWDALPNRGSRTAAVLVRRRSQIPLLSEALQAEGLPVEVVGLGGLLTTPEVVDVVSTLRVLVRFDAGTAVARLLTGARWRVGARDLAALRRRAAQLAQPDHAAPPTTEPLSLVEALDDLGAFGAYSPLGYQRLSQLSGELHRLRRRLSAPLPDLVADVERTIGVDIEVAARPDRAHIGRAHLDRFLDVAADFANDADEATLSAFLAFLEAAEDEENGLEAGEIVVDAERVQILTVHGAKGLEWDLVAVPGLVDSVFPADPRSVNWTRTRHELPGPLRGDRDDLPGLDLAGAGDRRAVRDRLDAYHQALCERHQQEERRLAYVALTRARSLVLASAYVWDTAQKPRDVSPFLAEILPGAEVASWYEPQPDEANPITAEPRTAVWPLDPLGPFPGDRGPGRRAAVGAGAALVRAAAEHPERAVPIPLLGRASQWAHDVDRLLAEQARLTSAGVIDVELPRHLSVSQLVRLQEDPELLAQHLRRPVPQRPNPIARRGTAFHTWLEQRWDAQALLDLDELPGAADENADDADFEQLRTSFLASVWANRTPAAVEVPFEMVVDGVVVRGRMDAVFGTATDGWQIVDWKTGRRPTGADAAAAAIQLAAYRLAWARLNDISDDALSSVRAAFHYVRTNETVAPANLLDATGLKRLVAGSTEQAAKTRAGAGQPSST
jgi:DNA helicase-2/ATP-dependent DNA helicase PcrA